MSQTIITANNKPAFVSNLSAFSQSGNEAWPGFLVILEPPVLEDRIKNQGSLFTIYVTMGEYELVWDHGDT